MGEGLVLLAEVLGEFRSGTEIAEVLREARASWEEADLTIHPSPKAADAAAAMVAKGMRGVDMLDGRHGPEIRRQDAPRQSVASSQQGPSLFQIRPRIARGCGRSGRGFPERR